MRLVYKSIFLCCTTYILSQSNLCAIAFQIMLNSLRSLLQTLLEYSSERRNVSNCFIDERLRDAKVLQRLHKMGGHFIEMSFIKAHRKQAVVLGPHMVGHIHIGWDGIGECQAHKLFLVRFEHVQRHTNEKTLELLIHDKSGIELVDGSLEGRFSANALKEMGLLLVLFLLRAFWRWQLPAQRWDVGAR